MFRYIGKKVLICTTIVHEHSKNIQQRNNISIMKKYLGIILIVLGALLLVISYLTKELVDYNWYQILCLLLIIGGIITHIVVTKKEA